MVRQPEIVIRAKINDRLTTGNRNLWLLRRGENAFFLKQSINPRLIELVRLMARRAARTYYEEQLRKCDTPRS